LGQNDGSTQGYYRERDGWEARQLLLDARAGQLVAAGPRPLGAPGRNVIFSRTPTVVGEYAFTVRATDTLDPGNFGVREFFVTVTPPAMVRSTRLAWTTRVSEFPSTTLGVNRQHRHGDVEAWSRGNCSRTVSSLSTDGVLSGTLESAGGAWFSVRAYDAGSGHVTRPHRQPGRLPARRGPTPPDHRTGSDLGTWTPGQWEWELRAEGGTGSHTWSLVSGQLAPWCLSGTDGPSWFSSQASARPDRRADDAR